MSCKYNILCIPIGLHIDMQRKDGGELPPDPKWSGPKLPPALGTKVFVKMNRLGPGRVESYFCEHGWFGVCVRLESPPEWHVRQSKGTAYEGCALVFGSEIDDDYDANASTL